MNIFRAVWNKIAGAFRAVAEKLNAGNDFWAVWRPDWHAVKASSFADPADVRAFKRCKAQGKTDQECFKVGDNGIGFTGLPCWRDDIAYVALPPEDMLERWGTIKGSSGKRVAVRYNGTVVECQIGDRMPALANIKNGCGIDLNPGVLKKLGLSPPVLIHVEWAWMD